MYGFNLRLEREPTEEELMNAMFNLIYESGMAGLFNLAAQQAMSTLPRPVRMAGGGGLPSIQKRKRKSVSPLFRLRFAEIIKRTQNSKRNDN